MAQPQQQPKQNDFRSQQRSQTSAQPQNTEAPPPAGSLEAMFEKSRDLFAKVAAKHITPDRLIKVALLARAGSEYLKQCTAESFLRCVIWCAELGLEPSGTYGGAHLVPRKNGRTGNWECSLVVDYRGMVELARRSGDVVLVEVGAVHENDGFTFRRGLNPVLEHEPQFTGDRGELVGFWAVVVYRDGTKSFEVMRRDEVEQIRDAVPFWEKGPWHTHFEAMGKKTVIRRAMNLAPKSKEYRRALEIEDEAETVDSVAVLKELPSSTGAVQVDFSAKNRASKVVADLKARTVDAPPAPTPEAQKPSQPQPPHPADSKGDIPF